LADYIWSAWIPDSSETILNGGYYSIDINADLKIVALNNIFCYNYNWYYGSTLNNLLTSTVVIFPGGCCMKTRTLAVS